MHSFTFVIILLVRLLTSSKIYIAHSRIKNAGLGAFADCDIENGELIETCPIILIGKKEVSDVRKTVLHNYYFMWGGIPNRHDVAICLGFGSLYNHSYTPNATYKKLLKEKLIKFTSIKDIKKDEEITVNYNYGNPNDKTKLWIKTIPPAKRNY